MRPQVLLETETPGVVGPGPHARWQQFTPVVRQPCIVVVASIRILDHREAVQAFEYGVVLVAPS